MGHHQIHTTIVASFSLHIIEVDAVDNRLEESEEQESTLLLEERNRILSAADGEVYDDGADGSFGKQVSQDGFDW